MASTPFTPPSASTAWPPTPTPQPASHEPLDIGCQLGELKSLKDGWADGMQPAETWGTGYGKAPNPNGLDWLASRFGEHYPSGLPKPYLYPTPEGGVQAEWSLAANEISLEIDLATHSAAWHCLNLDTDACDELVLDLDTAAAWRWLVHKVRAMGMVAA